MQRKKEVVTAISERETTLVEYLDSELYLATNAVFRTIFCRNLGHSTNVLPRCRQALKGFLKEKPSK